MSVYLGGRQVSWKGGPKYVYEGVGGNQGGPKFVFGCWASEEDGRAWRGCKHNTRQMRSLKQTSEWKWSHKAHTEVGGEWGKTRLQRRWCDAPALEVLPQRITIIGWGAFSRTRALRLLEFLLMISEYDSAMFILEATRCHLFTEKVGQVTNKGRGFISMSKKTLPSWRNYFPK